MHNRNHSMQSPSMQIRSSETVHLRLKMRTLVIILLLTTSFFQISQCVQVTDSGYSFSLEAVKTLKKLMETDTSKNAQQTYGDAESLCADPELPGEFSVLCEKDDSDEVFQRLVKTISPIDPCEICANVACTGCLSGHTPSIPEFITTSVSSYIHLSAEKRDLTKIRAPTPEM
ncbi:hypothetical protein QQF64_003876 [Cirrhinus molitorella]|uniref:Guanylate cyclase activator 2B n=1 Tax=Cirrhinus molitorella TaxID=172907 RepID=A0ABR3MMK3_9TELE